MDARESAVLKTSNKFYLPYTGVPQRRPTMILFRQEREFVHPILEVSLSFPYTRSGPWHGGQMEAIIENHNQPKHSVADLSPN